MNIKKSIHKILSVMFSAVLAIHLIMPSYYIPVKAYESLRYGIDVSYHNGTIDWYAVKQSGIEFAIIRSGYGKYAYQEDNQFRNNYNNAKSAGIDCGTYWYSYALSVDDAVKEADVCYSIIKGCSFEYPVFYDLEDASLSSSLSKAQITQIGIAFCERMKSYGYEVGVYANLNWFNNYINKSEFVSRGYKIWHAQYPSGEYAVDPKNYDKSSICDIWQYSSKGKVSGISGNVDVDVDYSNNSSTPSTPTTNKIVYYPACDSSYTSLVDALKSIGVDSSKENRKKIAGINGITNYEYTAKQNEELLNKLKDGKLIKEIVNVSCTTHTYGGWTVQTAATCTTDGTQTRKCTACGYTESGTIAKTGHSYGSWTVSKAATCTTDGTNTRKCSKCGNTETSTIAKTGHSYGSWTVSKAATCTTDGTNTRKCSKCGNTETSAIAKTGHNYVDNNVSATCTTDGKTEKKCKNCNDTITTVITATGHKYGEWTVSKNATCISDGVKTRKCSECDASETAGVEKTGHNYSETVIKPSCTTKGYTLYECTVCEDAYKDKYTDFAPHSYELTSDGLAECLNCGDMCAILFEGSGTQEDPFKISTAKDLFNLAEVVNNKDTNKLYSECYYVQTADIDLQNEKFTPIGIRFINDQEAGISFFGSYDGQYHTIKNLYVERETKFAGLFGSVNGSGIIENLIVEGKVVSSGPSAGGIIGEICNGGAIIRNCAFIGDVTSSSYAVGGVVGYLWLNGTIENCYHNGTVICTGESHAGGVVGAITAGKELDTNTFVRKCYHIGKINTAVPEYASTIVGFSEDLSETTGDAIITDCYAVKGEAYQAFGGAATQKEIIEISDNMLKIAYIDLGEPFVQAPDDSVNNGYPVFEWQLNSNQVSPSIGDINNDSKCDVTDLTYISLYLLGDVEFDDLQKDAADVNADGCVDIADLAHYKQFISKDNVVLGK